MPQDLIGARCSYPDGNVPLTKEGKLVGKMILTGNSGNVMNITQNMAVGLCEYASVRVPDNKIGVVVEENQIDGYIWLVAKWDGFWKLIKCNYELEGTDG